MKSILFFICFILVCCYDANNNLDLAIKLCHSKSMLMIHIILMRIRILDPHWKIWIRILVMNISIRFPDFFLTKQNCQIIFFFLSLIFILNLMSHSRIRKFLLSLFFNSSDLCSESIIFFVVFIIDSNDNENNDDNDSIIWLNCAED